MDTCEGKHHSDELGYFSVEMILLAFMIFLDHSISLQILAHIFTQRK